MSAVDVLAVMDVAALSQTISEDRKDMAEARAAVAELMEAATAYRAAVDLMDEAMRDGVNVQGAISGLFGATDNLDAALAACRGEI